MTGSVGTNVAATRYHVIDRIYSIIPDADLLQSPVQMVGALSLVLFAPVWGLFALISKIADCLSVDWA